MTEDSVVHTCNMQYHHVPTDFFWGVGGEILREINGQDHQTSMAIWCGHMLNLVMVIAIF